MQYLIPSKKINYVVENTRVGGKTDYDKLTLNITTTGTVSPEKALSQAIQLLIAYFNKISPVKKENAKKILKGKKIKTTKTKKIK